MERRKARGGPVGEGDTRVLRAVEWGSAFSVGTAQGEAGMLDLVLVITVDCSSIRSTFSSWKWASGG